MVPTSTDSFFDAVLSHNPFDVNRVTPASDGWADAADVYREPFEHLLDCADRAHRERSALGVLLWGEAGIGKSHLLGRLQHWAHVEPAPALFLPLANLQAEPQRLPRALLRGVMDLLVQGRSRDWCRTPLFRIVNGMVRAAVRGEGPISEAGAERRYHRLRESLCRDMPGLAAVLDQGIFHVLFRFFQSSHRQHKHGMDDGVAHLAVRYLRGDGLDNEEAGHLGLPPSNDANQAVALADDEQVKKTLAALSLVAWFWGRPMILALDQVDNLEPAQFQTLGRFLHALLDAGMNLVVITSGVRETLFRWREDKVLQTSSWDRIAQEVVELQRISPAACAPIVESRLRKFLAAFDSDGSIETRTRQDPLFPLGSAWLEERLKERTEVRPRDLIHWARLGWAQQQEALRENGGPDWLEAWGAAPEPIAPLPNVEQLIDQVVSARLARLQEKKKNELELRDWDAEGLADQLYELAKLWVKRDGWPHLQRVERLTSNGAQRATMHLVLHQRASATGPDLKRGVACLLHNGGTGLTGQLRRLSNVESIQELLLLYDQRSGFQPGQRGREYWEELTARLGGNARLVPVDLGEQARLAAIQALLAEAASQRLEVALSEKELRRLGRGDVVQSLERQELFPAGPVLNLLLRMEAVVEEGAGVGEGTMDAADAREIVRPGSSNRG